MTEEVVCLVDENNNVTGAALRSRMRAEKLRHRATYILVFNSRGQLYVQRRTTTKDIYPGCWDAAAGGVVLAGQSYEESAQRELEEELGIRATPLASREPFTPDSLEALRRYVEACGGV